MTTVLLVVAVVIVVLALVGTLYQMCTNPVMWLLHVCCDTVGTLLKVLYWVLAGIWEGVTGAAGS